MKSVHNKIYFLSIFIFLISLSNLVLSFKPDPKKLDLAHNRKRDNPNYRKECKVKEKCRECTFDELKNSPECQLTGYRTLKQCDFYDDAKLVDEIYTIEECFENTKMNSVYTLLIICIILGGLSFYIRKSHKSFILNQTLEKLTILRKHN